METREQASNDTIGRSVFTNAIRMWGGGVKHQDSIAFRAAKLCDH